MRIINFVDGASSETTPTIGNIVASSLTQYADDAAYEAAELGAPTTGNVYYNTTDNTIRYYNGTIWQEFIDESTTQVMDNKSIDADNNMITNIDNNEIKPLAGIEATKIADGSVTDTEFQYISTVTSNVQTQLDAKIPNAEKGAVNGVATLDGGGLVPAAQLPSYVDDVIEVANFAALPGTGETGKIYVTVDDNKTFRWTGSVYVEIGPSSQANNNSVEEGGTWAVVETPGGASQTIEQLLDGSGVGLNQDFITGQTFTPATNFTVNQAAVTLFSPLGMTGEGRLEIWGVDGGGEPDPGNVLATSEDIDLTTLAINIGSALFHQVVFLTPPALTGSTQYGLIFNPYNGTGAYTMISTTLGDVYAGGSSYYDSDGGASWTTYNNDFTFKIIEDAVTAEFNLDWDADAYVQQPGFDKTRNTIQLNNIDFTGVNDIAYVTINKTSDIVTNLTVNLAEMASYAPGEDDLIIARVIDSGVEIARKLYLVDTESATLEGGITPVTGIVQENISLIGKGSATWDADGAGTLDNTLQDQLTKDSSMSNVNSSFFAAGTFQATTTSSTYKKLTTHLISPAGTGTPNIEIWGVDGGGAPDSTNVIVVFPSYDPTVLVAGADVVHTAAATFSLTSGTSYAIVNNTTNLTASTIQFKGDSVGAAVGDDYFAAAPGTLGSWTLSNTKDIYFILEEAIPLGGRLTLSNNSFISVPALPDTYHQIDAQDVDMADGECGYITLDRGAGAPTSRTVTVDDIVNVVSDNNKLIITRNVVDECYLGLHDPQRLSDGDTVDIQKSAVVGGGTTIDSRFDERIVVGDITAVGAIPFFAKNDLVVGEWYDVSGRLTLALDDGASNHNLTVETFHNAVIVNKQFLIIDETVDSATDQVTLGVSFKFKAVTTSITWQLSGAGANAYIGGDLGESVIQYLQME